MALNATHKTAERDTQLRALKLRAQIQKHQTAAFGILLNHALECGYFTNGSADVFLNEGRHGGSSLFFEMTPSIVSNIALTAHPSVSRL